MLSDMMLPPVKKHWQRPSAWIAPLLVVSAFVSFFVEMIGFWTKTCPLSPLALLSLAMAFSPQQKPPPFGIGLDAVAGLIVVGGAIPFAIISIYMAANMLRSALVSVSTHCWRMCIAGGIIWLLAALRHAMNAYADCKRIHILKQRVQRVVNRDALQAATEAQQTLPLRTRIWCLLF